MKWYGILLFWPTMMKIWKRCFPNGPLQPRPWKKFSESPWSFLETVAVFASRQSFSASNCDLFLSWRSHCSGSHAEKKLFRWRLSLRATNVVAVHSGFIPVVKHFCRPYITLQSEWSVTARRKKNPITVQYSMLAEGYRRRLANFIKAACRKTRLRALQRGRDRDCFSSTSHFRLLSSYHALSKRQTPWFSFPALARC